MAIVATSVGADQRKDLPLLRADALALAGAASVSAGAIHAAAMGAHSDHRQAVLVFALTALFQVGWGVFALARTGRGIAAIGVISNAALVGGWVLATTSGIPFVDGLEAKESVEFASASAATFAAVAALGALMHLRVGARERGGRAARVGTTAACAGALVLALPGMTAAAEPSHHAPAPEAASAAPAASAVAPVPYDPNRPIDLGGVPGVTPEEQARAENLIATTLSHVPKYADPAVAEADGFRSINDGGTGYEHYINGDYRADGEVLNPDRPESLVYQRDGAGKKLVAVMYMAEPGTTLDSTPPLGGALTQWHIHDNLCFRADTGAVAGLTSADGTCRAGLVKPEAVPMIHVWLVPHRCGPFAALDGIAGGSVKPGEEKLCDAVHGHS